jgi:ribosomal protein L12E/L44/L45/RPP1/RPP2
VGVSIIFIFFASKAGKKIVNSIVQIATIAGAAAAVEQSIRGRSNDNKEKKKNEDKNNKDNNNDKK